jgi:hypothetical protein
MRSWVAIRAVSMLTVLILAGCGTSKDILPGRNEGTVKVYAIASDRAWEIARAVLRWEDCEAIEEHLSEGYLTANVGKRPVTTGEVLVWIQPMNAMQTRVTVVYRRRMQANMAGGMTEATFHRRFAEGVAIIRSGKSLPVEAP